MPILESRRVLDLSNERGLLCGQILADLGADVIAVEPPGGSSARRLGPFAQNIRDPERSLLWWSYSRNKRSITLDLEQTPGRDLLRRLAGTADFLIESFEPGFMARHELAYEHVAAINPSLVYVSITGFGQTGPKAHYADADLILLAAGGPLILGGDDDRPPVRLSVPQAYLHAGADAAVAAMVAHHERVRSGRGQHADVAAIQSVAMATQSGILAAPLHATEIRRLAGGLKLGPLNLPVIWPAKDGFISMTFLFGSALGVFTRKLMHYVCAQGFCDTATRDKDWIGYAELLLSGREPLSEFERVKEIVRTFTRTYTKAELLALALEQGFLMTPVYTIGELTRSEQLASREYWRTIDDPLGGSGKYTVPGPFVKFSATPIEYRRRPPGIGEHNREVYVGEFGLTESEFFELTRAGVI
jgi:crotonobetainyl-CoA:carnitine CoA-transferase CaiB-like acyl-CoA transferase